MRRKRIRDTYVNCERLEAKQLLTAPYSANDSYAADLNSVLSVDAGAGLLANDVDLDGDILAASLYSLPTQGSVSLNSDGSFTYFPMVEGVFSFSYQAHDGLEYGNIATVTVTVGTGFASGGPGGGGPGGGGPGGGGPGGGGPGGGGQNSAPVANDDFYSLSANDTLDVPVSGVLSNDVDDENDFLSAALMSGPSDGDLMFAGDGSFSFDPLGFIGTTSFTYRASDGVAEGNAATVYLTVDSAGGTGGALSVSDDIYFVEEATSSVELEVLRNDSSETTDLSLYSVSAPLNGASSYGYGYLSGQDVVFYSPDFGFLGADTFEYTAAAGQTGTGSVDITVHATDNTLGAARNLGLSENAWVVTGGIIGDGAQAWSDVDLFAIDLAGGDTIAADVDAIDFDGGGSLSGLDGYLRVFDSSGQEVTASDDGADPDSGQFSSDPFVEFTAATAGTYYLGISDSGNTYYDPTYSGGGYSFNFGAYRLGVLLTPGNVAPVGAVDAATTHHGTPVDILVLDNDTDADGDDISLDAVSSPSHGSAAIVQSGTESWIRYSPDSGFAGEDSFTYVVTDPTGATDLVDVTVSVTNTVPAGGADYWDAVSGVALSVDAPGVLANDADADLDSLSAVLVSGPSNGDLVLSADGAFSYQSSLGFVGLDSFTYRVSDGAGVSDPVTVSLEVYQFPTVGFSDSYGTGQNSQLAVDAVEGVLFNDWDFDGDQLSVTAVSSPQQGTLSLNANGAFDYTPNLGFVGSDTFTYSVTDGIHVYEPVLVTIEVTNFAPLAGNDNFLLSHDRILSGAAAEVLANDFDLEGSSLTSSLVSSVQYGSLTLSNSGTFTYSPNAGFTGTDTFEYQVFDGTYHSNVAQVTIEVVNTAPQVTDDLFYTPANSEILIDVSTLLENDADSDGDALVSLQLTAPENGSLLPSGDGVYRYSPHPDFSGYDTFTYTVSDGLLESSSAVVRVKVANSVSTAVNDFFTVTHDSPLNSSESVLLNDFDPDEDSLFAVLESPPEFGTVELSSDGNFSYIPNPDFVGQDSFSYFSSDSYSTSNESATVTIEVGNSTPISRPDSYSLHHSTVLTSEANNGLLANDSDADTDIFQAYLVAGPENGSLTLAADGTFSYEPNTGFSGEDTFRYKISDGISDSEETEVRIRVENTLPSVTGEDYSIPHDDLLVVPAPIGILANDIDIDGDVLVPVVIRFPSNGMLDLNDDGSFSYTPDSGFVGVDSFEYSSLDGAAESPPVVVTLSVLNSVPKTIDRSFTLLHDQTISVAAPGLLGFSGDADGDALTIVDIVPPENGVLTTNPDGSFSFTADPAFTGVASFSYRVSDGVSTSEMAVATLSVFNSSPILTSDSFTSQHSRLLTVTAATGLLVNDVDINDDVLTSSLVLSKGPANGAIVVNADGSFEYMPNAGFTGVDEFTYSVSDGAALVEATAKIVVHNSAPVAASDIYGIAPDTLLVRNATEGVLQNDFDNNADGVEAVLASAPSNGTLSLASDGSFIYQPNEGYVGTDSFTYRAKDSIGALSSETVVQISTSVVAVNDAFSGAHDRPIHGSLLANDLGLIGSQLTAVLVSPPEGGALTLGSNGEFTFIPDASYTGDSLFTYYLDDGATQSNTATVKLSVVNHTPIVQYGVWRTSHDNSMLIGVQDGLVDRVIDLDGDGVSFEISQLPSNGILNLNADGGFEYIPNAGFVGEDTFEWTATDGLSESQPQVAVIVVGNTVPTAHKDRFTVHSGTSLLVSSDNGVLSNDLDADSDLLSAELVTSPSHGVLAFNSDGSFEYTPENSLLNEVDQFTYRVSDGVSQSQVMTVDVQISNEAPLGFEDQFSITHDHVLTVPVTQGLLSNDSDADNDALTASIDSQPSHGVVVVNSDGSFSYDPAAGYSGPDSFTYKVSDGRVDSSPVNVVINVDNLAPIAIDDLFLTRRRQPITFFASDISGNDTDADGDSIEIASISSPVNGTLNVNSDGSYTYTPNAGFAGFETLDYQVSDGVATASDGQVQIEVLNAAPVAAPDHFEMSHGHALDLGSGTLTLNDLDLEDDDLTVVLAVEPSHGTLDLGVDGAFEYTPTSGFEGRDSFSYLLSDGLASSQPVTVVLDVVNARPTITDSRTRVTHDSALNVSAESGILSSAIDADGDQLSLVLQSSANYGTLSLQADGSWNYVPDAGFVGTDSFTYRVSDGNKESQTATLLIDVQNAPVQASTDSYVLDLNTTLNVTENGLLVNDLDADGDPLSVTLLDDVQHGSLTLNDDGTFTFEPTTGFSGHDSFVYQVSDGVDFAVATVNLTVTGGPASSPEAPQARKDFYRTDHSSSFEVDASRGVLANDYDAQADPLSVELTSGPGNGSLVLNDDGSFVYTPDAASASAVAFSGVDTFTYEVSDGVHSQTTTVEIEVRNSLPVAANASFDVHQGKIISTESGSLIPFVQDAQADELIFEKLSDTSNGVMILQTDGKFEYTPNAGFSGVDTFTYSVSDGLGSSRTGSVAIDVTNERPVVYDQQFQTQHGTTLVASGRGVLAAALDSDGDILSANVTTNPQNGTLSLAADGTFTYTPSSDFSGEDSFGITVSDSASTSHEALIRVSVDNQAPVTQAASAITAHGRPARIQPQGTDADGDALVFELFSAPEHGSLSFDNQINNGANGAPITFTGDVHWNPDPGFVGDDSFQYRSSDGVSYSDTVTVSLSATNFVPQVSGAIKSIAAATELVVEGAGLLALASDADQDTLSLEVVAQPQFGNLTLTTDGGVFTGGYTYQPGNGFAGQDSFDFRVFDGAAWSDVATVRINVDNQVPTLSDRSFRIAHSQGTSDGSGRKWAVDLAAAGIASDFDNDSLSFEVVTQPQNGQVEISTTGTLSFTATSSTFVGKDTIQIRATDGFGFSEVASIAIEITNVNPIASNDYLSVGQFETLDFFATELISNDFDFDGDGLSVVSVSAGPDGTLTQSGGSFTYDPDGFSGTTELTYIVTDGLGNSSPATVSIEVAENRSPVVGDRSFQLSAGEKVQLQITEGVVWDPEGDSVSFQILTQPAFGIFSISGSQISFDAYVDPGIDYSDPYGIPELRMPTGRVTATFRVSDGHTNSETVTYTFEVTPTMAAAAINPRTLMAADDENYPAASIYESGITASAPASNLPPTPEVEWLTLRPGQTQTGSFVSALTDPDGDTLSVVSVNGTTVVPGGTQTIETQSGQLSISSDGAYSFTSSGSVDIEALTINVSDGTSTVPTTVILDVWNLAPLPGARLEITASEGEVANDNILLNVKDRDQDVLSVAAIEIDSIRHEITATGTTISLDEGDLTIQPNGDYVLGGSGLPGWVDAKLFVTDSYSETEYNLPIARLRAVSNDSSYSTSSDETLSTLGDGVIGNVLANDSIPSGATVSVSVVGSTQGVYGSYSLNENGNLSYSVADGGQDGFLKSGGEPQKLTYEFTYSGVDASGTPYTQTTRGSASVGATILKPGESITQFGVTASNRVHGLNVGYQTVYSSDVYVAIGPSGAGFSPVVPGGSFVVSAGGNNDPSAGWSGDAAFVGITGYNVSVGGDVSEIVAYGYDIGFLSADVVRADAQHFLAGVTATTFIEYARGGTSVGGIYSGGSITEVFGGYNEESGIGPSVFAEESIGAVFSSGTTASVTAANGDIGIVYAGVQAGPVKALNGKIGGPNRYSDILDLQYGEGGVIGGTITSVLAMGRIDKVRAEVEIAQNSTIISKSGSIGLVKTAEDNKAAIVLAATVIDEVTSGGNILPVIIAPQRVGDVTSKQNSILSPLIAGGQLSNVSAYDTISSVLVAATGSILNVSAKTIRTPVIYAADSIGNVVGRGGNYEGSIEAGIIYAKGGPVGLVQTDRQLKANISGTSVGNVVGGWFEGSVNATFGIGEVRMTRAAIDGSIKATTSIGKVSAATSISGSIDGGTIERITAIAESIDATINSTANIGPVSAGTDISQGITASGSIHSVIAGAAHNKMGDISGDISAGHRIESVRANGIVIGDIGVAQLDSNLVTAAAINGTPLPKPSLTFTATGGNISGSITAGSYIGSVSADGKISKAITSNGYLAGVTALKDVAGNVSSKLGATAVTSVGGSVKGSVTAPWGASVSAYGNVDSAVVASFGTASAVAWGDILGKIDGNRGASASAYGNASGGVISAKGAAAASAGKDVTGQIEGAKEASAIARNKLSLSSLKSTAGSAFAVGIEGISAHIEGHNEVFATTVGKLQGKILSKIGNVDVTAWDVDAKMDGPEGVYAVAKNSISQPVNSANGSIFLEANDITASSITAPNGSIALTAYSSYSSTAIANGTVLAKVFGSTNGSLHSNSGGVYLTSLGGGNIDLTADTNGKVSVVSWGDLSGKLTSTLGDVGAFAYGKINSTVTAGKAAKVYSWESVTGEVSGGSGVTVFARSGVEKKISSAAGNIAVTAGGDVTSEIETLSGRVAISSLGEVTGKVTGDSGISVDAIRSTSELISNHGSITVIVIDSFTGKADAGGGIDITAGQSIQAAGDFIAGDDVSLRSFNSINGAQIEAGGAVSVSSIQQLSGVTVRKSGSIAAAGLKGVSGLSATSSGPITVYSGGNLTGTANSTGGDIQAVAIGDINGSYSSSLKNVTVTSLGSFTGSVMAPAGIASAFASTAVTGFFGGGNGTNASSIGQVTGTFAGGSTNVFAGGLATITTFGKVRSATIIAGQGVTGTVNTASSAEVIAVSGTANATVSGAGRVSASSVASDVSGTVTSSLGSVEIVAGGNFSGTASANDEARVTTIGDSSGNINGGSVAAVSALGEVSSPVTSLGSASVSAGTDISGAITANGDVTANSSTGNASGTITSGGSASVGALEDISGSVSGAVGVSAFALGDISGSLTSSAGSVSASAFGGGISSTLTAALDATAFGYGAVSGSVNAGANASVFSLSNVNGTVTAGNNASVRSLGGIKGSVSAVNDVTVNAFGNATPGSVTATNGTAIVTSAQKVTSTISAGKSAFVSAGGTAQVIATASDDAFLMSMGDMSIVSLTAGNNAFSWSAGSLAGTLSAVTGDAGAFSLGTFAGSINAGGDAFVFSFDMLHALVTAGGSATGIGMSMTAGSFTAGEDATVFSLGAAQPLSLSASGFAGLITLGGSNAIVSGDEGAAAWSAGDFNGTVTSANGPAGLSAIGMSMGSVSAGTDAFLMTGGMFMGGVTAGDSAYGLTLLDNAGSFNAGKDVVVISESDISGTLTAGGDAYALAVGDVRAPINAGNDAGAFALGSFGGSISAGGDITGVYAVGNLSGSLRADGNVGGATSSGGYASVFSHGSITTTIHAGNGTDGGNVGSVAAWGNIDGTITATQSIGSIRSAGQVNATLNAPSIGSVIENDPNLIASTPKPDIPDSVRGDLIAEVTAAIADIQASRADSATSIADMKTEFGNAISDAANAISTLKADVVAAVATAKTDAGNALAAQKAKAHLGIQKSVAEFSARLRSVISDAATLKSELLAEDQRVVDSFVKAMSNIAGELINVNNRLASQDNVMAAAKQKITDNANGLRQKRQTEWEKYRDVVREQIAALLAELRMQEEMADLRERLSQSSTRGGLAFSLMSAAEQNAELRQKIADRRWAEEATLALTNALSPNINNAWIVATGTDVLDRDVSGAGVGWAAVQLFASAAGASSALPDGNVGMYHSAFKASSTGRRINRVRNAAESARDVAKNGANKAKSDGCFYPGTLVHTQVAVDQAMLAVATQEEQAAEADFWWLISLAGAAATVVFLEAERRRRNKPKSALATKTVDELFAKGFEFT